MSAGKKGEGGETHVGFSRPRRRAISPNRRRGFCLPKTSCHELRNDSLEGAYFGRQRQDETKRGEERRGYLEAEKSRNESGAFASDSAKLKEREVI